MGIFVVLPMATLRKFARVFRIEIKYPFITFYPLSILKIALILHTYLMVVINYVTLCERLRLIAKKYFIYE